MHKLLFKDGVVGRDISNLQTDISALNAIVQAAVNVELFTIPLYMTTLYSLQGTHQITSSNALYENRWWPGMATSAAPSTPNENAFNAIFSVFIAEMFHLQMASNICQAVGVAPNYNSPLLQNPTTFGWTCYGPTNTIIPHILDFQDTIAPFNSLVVNLGPVNKTQMELFLAIEETEAAAEAIIQPDKKSNYFPSVPFANWQASNTEADLPLFGSIGWMYKCLWEYISISYTLPGGATTTLWDEIFKGTLPTQQDIFNSTAGSHVPEYPDMSASVTSTDSDTALQQLFNMIDGITDQGEGSGVGAQIKARLGLNLPTTVEQQFQPNTEALELDYPSYNDQGNPEPSADAAARSHFGNCDHFETFTYVAGLLAAGGIVTWDMWFDQGNTWTAEMLQSIPGGKYNDALPAAADIANALNALKQEDITNNNSTNYNLISQAAAGAIYGVTSVLNTYWSTPGATFPYPAMGGTGDRTAVCWAVFGKAPDLSLGIVPQQANNIYYGCQGLGTNATDNNNNCAAQAAYHTCIGSNSCMAQGGCGFIQTVNGGHTCNSEIEKVKATSSHKPADTVGGTNGCTPVYYSAPGDNRCQTFGGCAVPISASQLYPAPYANMTGIELYSFQSGQPVPVSSLPPYTEGTPVYQIAWQAYCDVVKSNGGTPPAEPPAPSNIRLAFPPST
ncbi:hypothetical protein HQ865_15540 [Mucilaginibacter mali]|uniref:Iminophenyl-pyruvate dimer synthase domain-containing protein n=1 Tax=Mucilaginibacter mali TaxID=2740462 RepID=A0A7D4PUW4_9SPHI|nr:ferritin-like domain-containing protein [Mucilaginibacter mali]QKJ31108.1 hypothetical protein HQ865_15540 [Mucilaginibacter mali]